MTAISIPIDPRQRSQSKAVGVWLLLVALLIAFMVTVGGLTRLTGSGLSITEWRPVTGVVPPLDADAWNHAFAEYRRIPQFQLENPEMNVDQFKSIYWWEWSHRLLGRILGAAFLLPFVYFVSTKAIARRDFSRMLSLFLLGGLQGFVGWWMVESGLETRVSVSPYRLAIHLGVAIVLLGAVVWAALDYLQPKAQRKPGSAKNLGRWGIAFVVLVYVQMLMGALVAGLHAGLIYNTWPSMNGSVFPQSPFFDHPWWKNFASNPGLAQFDHRIGAYLVAAAAFVLWLGGRKVKIDGPASASGHLLLAITGLQVALGIVTLLNQAPLPLAALHQATAVALYATAVWHAHSLRSPLTPRLALVPDPR